GPLPSAVAGPPMAAPAARSAAATAEGSGRHKAGVKSFARKQVFWARHEFAPLPSGAACEASLAIASTSANGSIGFERNSSKPELVALTRPEGNALSAAIFI